MNKGISFEVGDLVRIRKIKDKMERGYEEKYSMTIYKIKSIKKRMATLVDRTNDEEITVDIFRLKKVEDIIEDEKDIEESSKKKKNERQDNEMDEEEEEEEPKESVITKAKKKHKQNQILNREEIKEDNIKRSRREWKPTDKILGR